MLFYDSIHFWLSRSSSYYKNQITIIQIKEVRSIHTSSILSGTEAVEVKANKYVYYNFII